MQMLCVCVWQDDEDDAYLSSTSGIVSHMDATTAADAAAAISNLFSSIFS